MSEITIRSSLESAISQWIKRQSVCDEIGQTFGAWIDDNPNGRNAALMAEAAMIVLRSMALQSTLEQENNPDD